jgi:hypothetical protein
MPRLVIVALVALLAAPGSLIAPASAAVLLVVFWSSATNFGPLAPNGRVYVEDLATGTLTLVSPSIDLNPSLSADGTEVAFKTNATNSILATATSTPTST